MNFCHQQTSNKILFCHRRFYIQFTEDVKKGIFSNLDECHIEKKGVNIDVFVSKKVEYNSDDDEKTYYLKYINQ